MSLHFIPENTKVLLVGTTNYNSPDFAPITPALGNISELRKIFQNKDIVGLPNRNINVLINPNIEELIKSLKRLKSDPNIETFFFYYVGHGYVMWHNGQNHWFITAKDSVADVNDYDYVKRNSLEYSEFKDYIESIGQKRIVIFDACYSGQATQSTNSISNEIKGTFVMSSASANEQSLFNPSDEYTYFTKELIKVFKNGLKTKDKFLTINDVYKGLYEEIEKYPNLPKPTQKNNLTKSFNFVKNKQFLKIDNIQKQVDMLIELDNFMKNFEQTLFQLMTDYKKKLNYLERSGLPMEIVSNYKKHYKAPLILHLNNIIQMINDKDKRYIKGNLDALKNAIEHAYD